MFYSEDGAQDIISRAVDKYENHFSSIFPIYEYIDITKGGDYDFSIEGAKRLSEFIDKRIADNKPVTVPKGYEDRLY